MTPPRMRREYEQLLGRTRATATPGRAVLRRGRRRAGRSRRTPRRPRAPRHCSRVRQPAWMRSPAWIPTWMRSPSVYARSSIESGAGERSCATMANDPQRGEDGLAGRARTAPGRDRTALPQARRHLSRRCWHTPRRPARGARARWRARSRSRRPAEHLRDARAALDRHVQALRRAREPAAPRLARRRARAARRTGDGARPTSM